MKNEICGQRCVPTQQTLATPPDVELQCAASESDLPSEQMRSVPITQTSSRSCNIPVPTLTSFQTCPGPVPRGDRGGGTPRRRGSARLSRSTSAARSSKNGLVRQPQPHCSGCVIAVATSPGWTRSGNKVCGDWSPWSGHETRPTQVEQGAFSPCLLYTSPSPRDKRQSRMPSSA